MLQDPQVDPESDPEDDPGKLLNVLLGELDNLKKVTPDLNRLPWLEVILYIGT